MRLLASKAKKHNHEKEEKRPEPRDGHHTHCARVNDEGKARALFCNFAKPVFIYRYLSTGIVVT